MTFHELLHQVSFDEIVPFIERYSGWRALALYKVHYDYMRHLSLEQGEETTVTIRNGNLDEWEWSHLYAYPLEDDNLQHAVVKELIIEPDVKASLAEIAMCCLWETSFYGFIEEQMDDRYDSKDIYVVDKLDIHITRLRAKRVICAVKAAGGKVPSVKEVLKIRSFRNAVRRLCKKTEQSIKKSDKTGKRQKSMRSHARQIILTEYYKRLWMVNDIVRAMLKSSMSAIDDIETLLFYNHIQPYQYTTRSCDSQKRVEWMKELIEKYEAFNIPSYKNCIVCIGTSSAHPFRMEEMSIIERIVSLCSGTNAFYIYTDDILGQDMKVTTVFYD